MIERLVNRRIGPWRIAAAAAVIFGLAFAVARVNYLLALALVEGLAIAIALFVYVFATRTRLYTRDDYLLLLGHGSLAAALLDFFHLLTTPGMGVFAGLDANPSIQFWMGARYVQAFSFFIAPFAAKRRFRVRIVLPAYMLATVIIFLSIMLFDTFPTCHVEGQGFTPVKIVSEYAICVVLVAAMWFTYDYRDEIGTTVTHLVILSMIMIVASELGATLYGQVGGPVALLAHACKCVAIYLLFHGTVAEGLERPFRQAEEARRQLRERLRFEAMLTDISSQFAGLTDATDIRAAVRTGLAHLAAFLDADVALLVDGDETAVQLVESGRREGGDSPSGNPDAPATLAWMARQLHNGVPIVLADLPDSLPMHADQESRLFASQTLKVCALVPFDGGERRVTAIGVGAANPLLRWDEPTLQRLRLAGQIFAGALARERAQAEADRLRHELNHVARATTMGQLAAALAHEINQPLAAILSNAQVGVRLLEQTPPKLTELREILGDIVDSDRRAAEVIRGIRGFLQKKCHEQQPVGLAKLAAEVVLLARHHLAKQGGELTLHLPATGPMVMADRVQIQQVVLNLLMNAIEAMESVADGDRQLTVSVAVEGQEAVLAVTDTGGGIDDQQLANVFKPFFTTKPDGLGMGLAINQGIVEAHGGRLWARRNPGRGMTFSFALPLLDATPPSAH